MHYRVIPRDFFNEAKLLKCLGQFELCVNHTGANGLDFKIDFDGEPFEISQDPQTGNLSVLNYHVFLEGEIVLLYTSYNSRESYPLIAFYKGEEYFVFDENGKWMPNFGIKNEE